MNTFGAVLRSIRIERNLTQPRLAEHVGVSPSCISRLESNSRHPERATVGDIAFALNCTPAERDVLMLAAGYVDQERPRLMDMNLLLLDEMLQDGAISPDGHESLRMGISALLATAQALRGRPRVAVVRGRGEVAA